MFFLKNLLKIGGGAAAKKFQDDEKPFLDHLEDLRGTLFKVFGTLIISTLVAFLFYKQLIGIINYPIVQAGYDAKLLVLSPFEGFMSVLKVCLYAGLIVSFPIILYFIGEFIIPGLNDKEKKLIIPVVIASFILFAGGVLFAYFVVIPRALTFFQGFNAGVDISTELRFKYTVSFVTMMSLVFGLCFELPVVVMTLVKLDLLNSTMMRNTRSYAIVAMFMVAAIVTPTPDIFTMSLLAGPMIILYEICIWLAWGMERKEAKAEALEKELERKALVDRQKRAKQVDEAQDTKPKSEDEIKDAPPGTLAYDPGNEATFEDSDDEKSSDTDDEPEYDTGLGDIGGAEDTATESIPDDSDAVWDRPSADASSESDHAENPYPTGNADGHDDNHWDHDHHANDHDHNYHDDYYSGPTEELKRMLREELKADLKEIIKVELREEILAEIREELRRDSEEGA